jgi:hypothetical protein
MAFYCNWAPYRPSSHGYSRDPTPINPARSIGGLIHDRGRIQCHSGGTDRPSVHRRWAASPREGPVPVRPITQF